MIVATTLVQEPGPRTWSPEAVLLARLPKKPKTRAPLSSTMLGVGELFSHLEMSAQIRDMRGLRGVLIHSYAWRTSVGHPG